LAFWGGAYKLFIEPARNKEETTTPVVSEITLSDTIKQYKPSEIKVMRIPTIALPIGTALGKLVGYSLNENFSILVFGKPGEGKSHLATLFARELSFYGSVGYILTEENTITDYLQERITRYDLSDNVMLIPTKKVDEILTISKKFDFLIVDSLNGMLPHHLHIEFVRKLQDLCLKGLIIVNQSNKQGDSVGRADLIHDVDVVISMENKIAKTGKNRFGGQIGSYEITFNDAISKRRNII